MTMITTRQQWVRPLQEQQLTLDKDLDNSSSSSSNSSKWLKTPMVCTNLWRSLSRAVVVVVTVMWCHSTINNKMQINRHSHPWGKVIRDIVSISTLLAAVGNRKRTHRLGISLELAVLADHKLNRIYITRVMVVLAAPVVHLTTQEETKAVHSITSNSSTNSKSDKVEATLPQEMYDISLLF